MRGTGQNGSIGELNWRFIPAHAGNSAATRSSCWCSTSSAGRLRSGSSNTASRRGRARIRLRCARQLVIEQAIPQGAVRILDELRGLQVALRRSIALKKQARRELIHRRQQLTNPTARGGVFPNRIHRLMPLLECENDMGGRFPKSPFRDSQCRFHLSSVFSLACASMAGPAMPVWKSPGRTGVTPLRGPGAGMGRCGFSQTPHRPWSLPSKVSLREGS